MATLPTATVTIDDEGGPLGGGVDYCAVIGPVKTNADSTPRVFTGVAGILEQHDFSEAVDYAALHFQKTKKPLIFIGVPIATAGVISRTDSSGNTGTSVVSAVAGGDGCMSEHDGAVKVVTGGTIGTDQIKLSLSLDGGTTWKPVRLGTANSYSIPYVNVTLNFAAGTLIADDTAYTWHGSGPMWDATGLNAARDGLAAQTKLVRSWLIAGDVTANAVADSVVTEANAYETENERFIYARASVRDRLPLATMSQDKWVMTGAPNITFATAADTITRSAGSWASDGAVAGDTITITGAVAGSGANNITTTIESIDSATQISVADNLTDEGPIAGVAIWGTPTITFAEVGGTGDTITRSRGSWLTDGVRIGDKLTIADSVSNDGTTDAITNVTATVITLDTYDLVAETIGSYGLTIRSGETKAEWIAAMDSEYADIADQKRLDLSIGRGRIQSPVTLWQWRRPAGWLASLREFSSLCDLHIATFWKALGPLDGVGLNDTAGNLVEYDERVDGGALAANFTCLRTYANGPAGAYVALSLTRAEEASLLSRTHNMAVANLACSVVHAATENALGQSLVLNADGTATTDSLSRLENQVNSALEIALLQDHGKGPRCSSCRWTAATDDDLSVVGATLNGTLLLNLRGTIEKINTTVKVS